MSLAHLQIMWSIGRLGRNKPTDIAAAQVLLNLAARPGVPPLTVDGKLNPATLAALQAFQAKHGGGSRAVPSIEPASATIRALVAAAFPAAQRLMQLPQGTASAISERDYDEAARSLNCEAAAVKAVAAVESAGHGFLASGKPKILFESRVFSRETEHKYDHLFPDISSRHQKRALYRGGEDEYKRLKKAMLLDRTAALRSASWGKFQILGLNFHMAGQPSLSSFIGAMFQSEGAHLDAFCAFVTSRHLVTALRSHDWASFAERYNGTGYSEKHYDRRIKEEYDRARAAGPQVAAR